MGMQLSPLSIASRENSIVFKRFVEARKANSQEYRRGAIRLAVYEKFI